jgi:hypothetical protein
MAEDVHSAGNQQGQQNGEINPSIEDLINTPELPEHASEGKYKDDPRREYVGRNTLTREQIENAMDDEEGYSEAGLSPDLTSQ